MNRPLYYHRLGRVNESITQIKTRRMARSVTFTIPDMGQGRLERIHQAILLRRSENESLIVDVRGNGGGFVSPLVIERSRRALVMVETARNGTPQTNPPQHLHRSDGDLDQRILRFRRRYLPYRFKTLGLGKLIGKRTWAESLAFVTRFHCSTVARSSGRSSLLTPRRQGLDY